MAVDVLDEARGWLVELPNEDVYRRDGRWLRAIKPGGAVQRDWVWSDEEMMWTAGDYFAWSEVIAMCMRNGWVLYSMPPEKCDPREVEADEIAKLIEWYPTCTLVGEIGDAKAIRRAIVRQIVDSVRERDQRGGGDGT